MIRSSFKEDTDCTNFHGLLKSRSRIEDEAEDEADKRRRLL
jgi:hypothetical protein